MGIEFRRDCNLAMAHMLVALDSLLEDFNRCGNDLVQTIGIINSGAAITAHPHIEHCAVSKVGGAACFSLEIRGIDAEAVMQYMRAAEQLIEETAAGFGVSTDIETFSEQAGVSQLDTVLQQRLVDICESHDYRYMHLPSGAWHDAATVSQAQKSDGSPIPTAMIFIPCRDGISHHADEYASDEQIATGATVLAKAMQQLASAE